MAIYSIHTVLWDMEITILPELCLFHGHSSRLVNLIHLRIQFSSFLFFIPRQFHWIRLLFFLSLFALAIMNSAVDFRSLSWGFKYFLLISGFIIR